jgi:hypothetical protein
VKMMGREEVSQPPTPVDWPQSVIKHYTLDLPREYDLDQSPMASISSLGAPRRTIPTYWLRVEPIALKDVLPAQRRGGP